MKAIGKWLRAATQQVLDPDKHERIQEVSALLYHELKSSGDGFSIDSFINRSTYTLRDVELAKRRVFHSLLANAWKDGKIVAKELKTLEWAQRKLAIPADEAKLLQHESARDKFSVALANAMDDGEVSEVEARNLEEIAQSVGCSLSEFVEKYFLIQGEDFLRGVFAACTEGGVLADDAWDRLISSTERLGMSKKKLAIAILPQAERFVEHVLADAKSDGELSEEEESHLTTLVQTLGLPHSSQSYVNQSIASLRIIRRARQGKLPVLISPIGVSVRAGEIVHFHKQATWHQRRILKTGDRWEEHVGYLMITDNRLLFTSDTRSFDARFGRIARHAGRTGIVHLQRMEKPESILRITEEEPVAYAILEGAIALSNQTRIANQSGVPSRHIPRDVRQRVWQRYGGRCAECGANQYLEFDHVIPIAKGGSNSDSNV